MTRSLDISLRWISTTPQPSMNATTTSHAHPSVSMSRTSGFTEKQIFLRAQYNLPRTDFNAKLVPNLMNKKKYVVDFRLLKFYIQHGLILTKIHRGIKYHQRAWMAPYIAVNQEMREQATTPFQKEVFKLMNNSVFGKNCENQKKRTSIQLALLLQ